MCRPVGLLLVADALLAAIPAGTTALGGLTMGAEVVAVVAVVDRGGVCASVLEAEGVPFIALVTAPDLGFAYEGA